MANPNRASEMREPCPGCRCLTSSAPDFCHDCKKERAKMTYQIEIDEEQRLYIAQALARDEANLGSTEERQILLAMFEQLPRDEAETPGCLHGFSL